MLLKVKNKINLFIGLLIGLLMIVSSKYIISIDPMAFEPKRFYIYLFTVIPGLAIIILKLFPFNKKLSNNIVPVCILVYVLGLIRGCMGLGWETSGPFTDIKYYKQILEENNYPHSPYIKHFPAEIPESASNIKIEYFRGFLQGEKFLRLSMTLSDSDFESTLEKFGVDKEEIFTEIKYVTTSEMAALKAQSEILKHKYYMSFITEDYYIYPDDFIFGWSCF